MLHTYKACTQAHLHAVPVEVVKENRIVEYDHKSMKNRIVVKK